MTEYGQNNADQPSLDELITLSEAAEKCGLSHSHIRLLVRNGEIWGKKVGNFWFTTEQAVREYIARDIRPGRKPRSNS
jgi:excisionase family DNA binding protein